MTLYISHVTRKAWKALILFYWQSVAERQKRKLIQLQNLRYRSDAVLPKMQKLLKTPAGFKNHTLVDQQKSSRHSTQANISTHPELLAVDLLSSEEEEDEEDGMENEGICFCAVSTCFVSISSPNAECNADEETGVSRSADTSLNWNADISRISYSNVSDQSGMYHSLPPLTHHAHVGDTKVILLAVVQSLE